MSAFSKFCAQKFFTRSHSYLIIPYVVIYLWMLLFFPLDAECDVWQVGPTRIYHMPSEVAGLVADGDTVQIDAGNYVDCVAWTRNDLLLQGVGNGYAHCMQSVCGYKGIWVINAGADNVTIENMEFSGASISGSQVGNGAGLRAQGGSYDIRHCYFHDNQNGILCNPNSGNDSADILIEYSVFADNGCATGDASGCNPGYEHNMYIGSGYRSFTLQYSFTHGAINGHNIKTRARNNYILCNSTMDMAYGTGSYDVDIAQGGPTVLMGNLIEAGPHKVNHNIICYNEGSTNPGLQDLYLINNTFVNDQNTGFFLFMPLASNDKLTLINNIFAGPGLLFNGNSGFSVIDTSHNIFSTDIAAVGLQDPTFYNYQLTDSSPAINAGVNAGFVDTFAPFSPFLLTPVAVYVDSAQMQPRNVSGGLIDIGTYEFADASSNNKVFALNSSLIIAQNAGALEIIIRSTDIANTCFSSINIYDISGQLIVSKTIDASGKMRLSTNKMAAGIYIAKLVFMEGVTTNLFVVTK